MINSSEAVIPYSVDENCDAYNDLQIVIDVEERLQTFIEHR